MKIKDSSGKYNFYKTLLLNLILFLCVTIFITLLIIIPKINIPRISEKKIEDNRTYNIAIVGEADSTPFLQKVYEGARKIVSSYDAVVDFHVPASRAQKVSFQDLLDYAVNSNADGIIAYVPEYVDSIKKLMNRDGVSIPLVTMGRDLSDSPQISHIGSNFHETGRIIAREITGWYKINTKVLILNPSEKITSNYSTLQNSMLSTLNITGIEGVEVLENNEMLFKGVFSSKVLTAKRENVPLIVVCISESDTVNVATQISDLMYTRNTKIIGGGQNEAVQYYFHKGVITELISLDYESMGKNAINQIFEYKTKGSANRIVNVDITVQKAGEYEKE